MKKMGIISVRCVCVVHPLLPYPVHLAPSSRASCTLISCTLHSSIVRLAPLYRAPCTLISSILHPYIVHLAPLYRASRVVHLVPLHRVAKQKKTQHPRKARPQQARTHTPNTRAKKDISCPRFSYFGPLCSTPQNARRQARTHRHTHQRTQNHIFNRHHHTDGRTHPIE